MRVQLAKTLHFGTSARRRTASALCAALAAIALGAPPALHGGAGALGPDGDGDGLLDSEEIALGTSPRNPDTDGDGLLDGWEVHGYSHRGQLEPLDLYGAHPRRKDVFVEIDWMESSGEPGARSPHENAIIAYQAAVDIHRLFVESGTGIRIHFDLGPDILDIVPPELQEDDAPDFSRLSPNDEATDPRKALAYQDRFPLRPPCDLSSSAATSPRSLHDVYYDPACFRPSRRNVFYYLVIAERHGVEAEREGDRRGFTDSFSDESARRAGLRPAGVQVGVVYRLPAPGLEPRARRYVYSVSVLHELGHGFGLGHGGSLPDGRWDSRNHKPNYPSVMNYSYQFWGVDVRDGLPVMDFSRGRFRAINESALLEAEGLGLNLPNAHVLENLGVRHLDVPGLPWNLDWNGNGVVDLDPVHEDLDSNGRVDTDLLRDHDDWGKFLSDGFSGIGRNAFRGCGLGCGISDTFLRIPSDLDGDGIADILLFSGRILAGGVRERARVLDDSRGRGPSRVGRRLDLHVLRLDPSPRSRRGRPRRARAPPRERHGRHLPLALGGRRDLGGPGDLPGGRCRWPRG